MDRHAAECQSLMLAIRLQQQEILQWEAQRRGRQEPTSDADLAMHATAEELKILSATVSDRMTSISLAQGRDPQGDRAAADARVQAEVAQAEQSDRARRTTVPAALNCMPSTPGPRTQRPPTATQPTSSRPGKQEPHLLPPVFGQPAFANLPQASASQKPPPKQPISHPSQAVFSPLRPSSCHEQLSPPRGPASSPPEPASHPPKRQLSPSNDPALPPHKAPRLEPSATPHPPKRQLSPSNEAMPSCFKVPRLHPPQESSKNPSDQPESSAGSAGCSGLDNTDATKKQEVECISCSTKYAPESVVKAPCSHQYCCQCLAKLFEASLRDESLFPPRCCGKPIPAETTTLVLTPLLIDKFNKKKVEHETIDKTYCHEPTCSVFLPPDSIKDKIAFCSACNKNTCVGCKGPSHKGECPNDVASQAVLQLAKKNGWQQCKSCKRVVELDTGCFHMTCLCRAEFCYTCGKTWKTCKRPQWSEARLLARAQAIVDRRSGRPGPNRAQEVRQMQERLQEHCYHGDWQRRRGRATCEECGEEFRWFIYECEDCSFWACADCRLNRL